MMGSGNEEKPFYDLNGDPSGLTEKKSKGSKMKAPASKDDHTGKGFLDNVEPLF